jgi:hypothetical protein
VKPTEMVLGAQTGMFRLLLGIAAGVLFATTADPHSTAGFVAGIGIATYLAFSGVQRMGAAYGAAQTLAWPAEENVS